MGDIHGFAEKRWEKYIRGEGQITNAELLDAAKEKIAKIGEKNVRFLQVIFVSDDPPSGDAPYGDNEFVAMRRDNMNFLEKMGVHSAIMDYMTSE